MGTQGTPETPEKIQRVGDIGNKEGGLHIAVIQGVHYWSIDSEFGHDWEVIPKELYDQIAGFEESKR